MRINCNNLDKMMKGPKPVSSRLERHGWCHWVFNVSGSFGEKKLGINTLR